MTEREWVSKITPTIQKAIQKKDKNIYVEAGIKLPYTSEIISYKGEKPEGKGNHQKANQEEKGEYETDMLVYEKRNENGDSVWIPRVIIEVKKPVSGVTTHDAIIYSEKASTHKTIHPYLRYGILVVSNKENYLPKRLVWHGNYFDFMAQCADTTLSEEYLLDEQQLNALIEVIEEEIEISRMLKNIIYDEKLKNYTILHRPLVLK
jgi:hypothetical protein